MIKNELNLCGITRSLKFVAFYETELTLLANILPISYSVSFFT